MSQSWFWCRRVQIVNVPRAFLQPPSEIGCLGCLTWPYWCRCAAGRTTLCGMENLPHDTLFVHWLNPRVATKIRKTGNASNKKVVNKLFFDVNNKLRLELLFSVIDNCLISLILDWITWYCNCSLSLCSHAHPTKYWFNVQYVKPLDSRHYDSDTKQ